MTDVVFWAWLQDAIGLGSVRADRIIREFSSPEALYGKSARELEALGMFAPKEIERLRATTLDRAREQIKTAERLGCMAIGPDHPDYPEALTNIDAMPCILYVKGSLSGLSDELVITMVGTRSATEYGLASAYRLSHDLAAAGCTVVSGLATGIDTASHAGALQASGRTIGLLACGLDVDYPSASGELKRRILDAGGALVTEFPFGTGVNRGSFSIRNRLLSGIAAGVVVVQAPERSGALITARYALQQNRDVFAVPGEIFDPSMAGCNKLARDGAKVVVNVYSILEEYIGRFPKRIDARTVAARIKSADRNAAKPPQNAPRRIKGVKACAKPATAPKQADVPRMDDGELAKRGVTPQARAVYAQLGARALERDELAALAGLGAAETLSALTELELTGFARAVAGGRYIPSAPGGV